MREILFRGKRANNGEWFEGAYYHQTEFYGDECDYHYIISSKDELEDNMMCTYLVDPETIGQYTGLTDKNGKRIFEGDIVKAPFCGNKLHIMTIQFFEGGFWIVPTDKTEIDKNRIWKYRIANESGNVEVIGNIHDNPELLNEV